MVSITISDVSPSNGSHSTKKEFNHIVQNKFKVEKESKGLQLGHRPIDEAVVETHTNTGQLCRVGVNASNCYI